MTVQDHLDCLSRAEELVVSFKPKSDQMSDWNFSDPLWLCGLIAIPIAFIMMMVLRSKRMNHYGYSQMKGQGNIGLHHSKTIQVFYLGWLWALFVSPWLAPDNTSQPIAIQNLGIDVMLALDISTSMLAKDLKPNRLEALEIFQDYVVGEYGQLA